MLSLTAPAHLFPRPGRYVLNSQLHPWLSTPEALAAAKRAVNVPRTYLAGRTRIVGVDELESQALVILAECAQPHPKTVEAGCAHCGESLDGLRKGAKFCGRSCKSKFSMKVVRGKEETLAPSTQAHVGSMWTWPAEQMAAYAQQQVGFVLLNYVRSCHFAAEITASEAIANMDVTAEADEDPRELVVSYLEAHGVRSDGTETFAALAEAALSVRNHELRGVAA